MGESKETRILIIGENAESGKDVVGGGTILDAVSFRSGVPHLEYLFYQQAAAGEIVRHALRAENEGYDAVLIACFHDPGIREARELVRIPVVGVGEASLHLGAMLSAGGFSVLVGRRKWIAQMSENARALGLESKIRSWRVLGLGVHDMRDERRTRAAVLREARVAIEEDSAESICLGCTGMKDHAGSVQEELGVPVIDPFLVGVKVAELRAALWKRFGISHSKIGGYETPPRSELERVLRLVCPNDSAGTPESG